MALWGKTRRTELQFPGWHLRPIYTGTIMYVHVCIGSTDESQHRPSMWQHVLEACIKHSHEMEEKHDVTARRWQNGREGAALMKDERLT